MKGYILITFALIALTYCENPNPKVWEDQWQADFTEKISVPIIGSDDVSGVWSYDWKNKRFAVSRSNGKYDRYCGSIYKFQNTPCTHIVKESKRYIIFPEKKFCCMCCTSEKGCGIVKPDWFASGEYQGEKLSEDKTTSFNDWLIKGLQENYYGEQVNGQTPYRIWQKGTSDMVFKNYRNKVEDENVFNLPVNQNCEQSCGWLTTCRLLK
jgi:hypothetical protein